MDHLIEFSVCDYADTPIPDGAGVVVLNPEYGERMGKTSDLADLYKGLGDFFKQRCRGYAGYIFTGNLSLAKKVGLRTRRRIQFYNGPIECRLPRRDAWSGAEPAHPIRRRDHSARPTARPCVARPERAKSAPRAKAAGSPSRTRRSGEAVQSCEGR